MEAGSSLGAGAHDVCVRSGERDEQWREIERTRASDERLSLRGKDVLTATGHEFPPRIHTCSSKMYASKNVCLLSGVLNPDWLAYIQYARPKVMSTSIE